ncbi:hypothetical protein [Kribbella sp. NBC_00359]|uniref:hypothetical protein n=1 Tax=Kribbella sp. NBC_00359 TaxID=2975966 RepID=UPI002E1F4D05
MIGAAVAPNSQRDARLAQQRRNVSHTAVNATAARIVFCDLTEVWGSDTERSCGLPDSTRGEAFIPFLHHDVEIV